MYIRGAMNRRCRGQWCVRLACLAAAATLPFRVVAFQHGAGNVAAPEVGDSKTNPRDGLRYVWIPPGSFIQGCSPGDKKCYEDETPIQKITLTQGFWLGQTEVTQAAFQLVMEYNPSIFEGANLPVESVTWTEADAYCRKIERPAAQRSGVGVRRPSRDNRRTVWKSRRHCLVLEQ